ncbi:MAG: hypothetical protein EB170_01300, partial [Nitrosopumilaceae archaeon]|nr:hypothetical protein [Nitrosopumilaceae archaeon]
MRRLIISLALIFLFVSSVTVTNFASAYEKENHYWLKMALALNCGFTIDEARVIATGDWNMDEDSETAPVRTGSGTDNPKWKWHALPTEDPDVDKNQPSAGNQQIKQRQHDLYNRALNEKDTGMRLFKFGQYLHYEEDKWSHWGYTTGIGHALPNVAPGMTSPDQTHANPETYRYMVFDSMVNLGKLAKSLGKDTQCVSDLVPLDTYHGSPEYGKDFPWVSPQEIKRSNSAEFKKAVDKYLSDWGKTTLINEVIGVSKKKGEEGVTESFISYISVKTGISKSDVGKKYDYIYVDIDDDGDAKKLPDNLVKSILVKPTKITTTKPVKPDSTKETKSAESAQLKNDLQKLYQIGKYGEKITSIIKHANDNEYKALKKLSGDTKLIYSKTKSPEAKKLGDKIQEQLKDTEKDKKQIDTLDVDSKKITKQILDIAKDNKISKTDLDKAIENKLIDRASDLLNGKPIEKWADEKWHEFREKLTQEQKSNPKNPDAPPESILDDVEINGPDVSAPKEKSDQGIKHGESVPGLGRYGIDWGDTYEDMMMLFKQQTVDLQKQTNDQIVLVDIQHQFDELKQKIVIIDPKKSIIQKDPTKLPDSKIDNTKKPTQIQPKSDPIETKEKPIIQKDPTTEPKPSNTKPTLSIPKQVTQEATGPNGANVSFSTSSQDKEDGSLTPTCTPPSGSVFQIGATSVSCTVTDSNNNSVTYTSSGTAAVHSSESNTTYFGSTGSNLPSSSYNTAYTGNASAGAVTGPQGNTAGYVTGPQGNTVYGTNANNNNYYGGSAGAV